MIEISNRHFALLIDKLPRVLELARQRQASLRQTEDLRQLFLLHKQFKDKQQKLLTNKNNSQND